jgi:asparagine synthetase B (glutamine-hydrolysing)
VTGFVAIVSHDRSRPLEDDELARLVATYERLRGTAPRRELAAGAWSRVVAWTMPAAAPTVAEQDASWALAVGVVHARDGILNTPLRELDGQFGLIRFRAEADEVVAATDPFGLRGVYVAEREARTYVSTSALALALHLRLAPSALYLAAFLRTGRHYGRPTHWEGLHRLEPGAAIRVDASGHEEWIYWRAEVDPETRRLSASAALDRVHELSRRLWRDHFAGRPRAWADLTGGYDSRVNNLLLRDAGVDVHTGTRGSERSPDVLIAKRVAAIAGLEWTHIVPPSDYVERAPELHARALAWGDGQRDLWVLTPAMAEAMTRARSHRALIGGGGGEYLRSWSSQQEFWKAGRTHEVNFENYVDMRQFHAMDTSIFARDPTAEVRADHIRRSREWGEPWAGWPNNVQLDMLWTYHNAPGHFGAMASAVAGTIEVNMPFFSRELVELVMSIDHRHRTMGRLVRRLIERLDPKVAAVPLTWGGPAQPLRLSNAHRFLPFYANFGRRAANKVGERVLGRSLFPHGAPPDEQRLAGWHRFLDALAPPGRGLRASDFHSAPLYRLDRLDDLLRRERSAFDEELLGRIVAVELVLREMDVDAPTL